LHFWRLAEEAVKAPEAKLKMLAKKIIFEKTKSGH